MKYPIEENLPYAWLAIIVLAVFYAIYFAKMISQKRHGIQTHQIGRVKEKSVHRVEVLMSIATLAAPVIQIMSIIFGRNHMPVNARFTGFCIGMLGDLIFLISVLCMKDSWRAVITITDGYFTGNYVGDSALAAINLGLPILYLYLGTGLCVGVGGSVISGRLLGAKNRQKASEVFAQTIVTEIAISAIISLVVFMLFASYGMQEKRELHYLLLNGRRIEKR